MSEQVNEPENNESQVEPEGSPAQLSSRLNLLELRVRNLEARLEDVRRDEGSRKQRALIWRAVLLAVLLGGYFFLRALRS